MGLNYYISRLFPPFIPDLENMRWMYFLLNNLSSNKIYGMLSFTKISYYYVVASYGKLKFVKPY